MLIPLLAITAVNYDSYCLTNVWYIHKTIQLFKLPQDVYKILGSDCKYFEVPAVQHAKLKLCIQQ